MNITPITRRSSLVDHTGRPIDMTVLREELSAPSLGSVRNPIGGHPAQGLTPQRLAAILRSAEQGAPRLYYELAEDMEEKDLHYLSVLGTRKRQVAQLEITVEAASDDPEDVANADLIRDWLARDALQDDLFDIMDAVGKGHSLTELIWDTSEGQWTIDRMEWVDPRFQEFADNARDLLLLDDQGIAQPLKPFKYLTHRVKAKSGLTIRGGLARPVAWAWMFKNYTVKDWVAFAEVYGLPFRVGKYEPGATAQDKRTLLRAVSDISSDAAAIVPKSMDIEFITGQGSQDGSLFQKGADWFDSQITKAVLGQTGTTDMKAGGYAQAKVHDGVRDDIEKADAVGLAGSINRDVVRPMVDLNRGPPKSGKYPRVMVGRAESWDATVMMPLVEKYVGMGGKVGMSTIRDRLGIEDPGEDEELLKAPATAPAVPVKIASGSQERSEGRSTTPEMRLAASTAFSRLLTAAALAGGGASPQADPIDRFIADQLGDWKPLVDPMTDPLVELVQSASSIEEIRDGLIDLVETMDPTKLGELLAAAGFNARLAGAAGAVLATGDN